MSWPGGRHCSSLLGHWPVLGLPLLWPWRSARISQVPEVLGCWRCRVPCSSPRAERSLILRPLCPSRPLNTKHPFHHPIISLTPFKTHRNASRPSSGIHVIICKVLMVQLGLMPGVGSSGWQPAPRPTLPAWADGRRNSVCALTNSSPCSLTRGASAPTSSASTSSWITRRPGWQGYRAFTILNHKFIVKHECSPEGRFISPDAGDMVIQNGLIAISVIRQDQLLSENVGKASWRGLRHHRSALLRKFPWEPIIDLLLSLQLLQLLGQDCSKLCWRKLVRRFSGNSVRN